MTCRDCLGWDFCKRFVPEDYLNRDCSDCPDFKNKAEYRHIRFKTGDTVFWWEYPKLQSAKVIQFGGQEDSVWYTLATGKGKKVVVINQNRLYATEEEAEQALRKEDEGK